MAPIWSDILSAIRIATEADNLETMKNNGVPKFFLISGHDLTLLPMLIALGPKVWDKKWIPYASMLIIEVRYQLKIICKLSSKTLSTQIFTAFDLVVMS